MVPISKNVREAVYFLYWQRFLYGAEDSLAPSYIGADTNDK
jgi:hypothetical protein